MKNTTYRKIISFFLLFMFSLMVFLPTVAQAAPETKTIGTQTETTTSDKKANDKKTEKKSHLQKVSAQFVNALTEKVIAENETYNENNKEFNPQEIKDWVYTNEFKEDITYVYSPKPIPYIVGYPDKTVRPMRYLTRAEATAIFYRLYDGGYPEKVRTFSNKTFKDLDKDAWYKEEVQQMYESGIINGTGDNKFEPNRPITRAELATFATKFNSEKFGGHDDGKPFIDVKPGAWYSDAIAIAKANGWLNGYPDSTFAPNKNISRAETMAVINRVLDRQITTERLVQLKVKNPYTDITTSDWAYADALEATVKHKATDWHDMKYNDGKYDQIIERFVDKKGNTIAKELHSDGKKMEPMKEIPGMEYLGYVRIFTYIYDKGTPQPTIKKENNVMNEDGTVRDGGINVGDKVKYTITVDNNKKATDKIRKAIVTDKIPNGLKFIKGSVMVDKKAAEYEYDNETKDLKVDLGNIEAGKKKVITFEVEILKESYGKEIANTAVLNGKNFKELKSNDSLFKVIPGVAKPVVLKENNVTNNDGTIRSGGVNVNDKVVYTVTVINEKDATASIKKPVITDVIPEGVELVDGSIRVNNESTNYSYDGKTRTLSVKLDNVAPNSSVTLNYAVKVNKDSYDKEIKNIAVLTGKNIDKLEANDKLFKVNRSKAYLEAKKVVTNLKKSYQVGDEVAYEITVKALDRTKDKAYNTVVTDMLPEELDFNGVLTVDGKAYTDFTYDEKNGLITVSLGDMAPDSTHKIAFKTRLNTNAYGKDIINVAHVRADNADGIDASADIVKIQEGKAHVTVTKDSDIKNAKVGDRIMYTVTASASEVSQVGTQKTYLRDIIPEELTFDGMVIVNGLSNMPYKYNNKTRELFVDLAPIMPGTTTTVQIRAIVNEKAYGKKIDNVAQIFAENLDPKNPDTVGKTNNPVVVEPGKVAGHTSQKTVNKNTVNVGETATYTIKLTNDQTATAAWENIKVDDVLPNGLEFVGNVRANGKTTTAYNYNKQENRIVFMPDSIEPGKSVTFEFDVKVMKGQEGRTFTNQAVVTSTNGGNPEPITSTPIVVPAGDVKPSIVKTHTIDNNLKKNHVRDLDTITYNIQVKNGKDATATWKNVIVKDELPSELELFGAVVVDGKRVDMVAQNGNHISIPVGDIAPGETVNVVVTAKVRQGVKFNKDEAIHELRNVAVARGDNGDEVKVPDDQPVLHENPNYPKNPKKPGGEGLLPKDKDPKRLVGVKTIDKNIVDLAGDATATYRINLINSSEETARNVVLEDVLELDKLSLYHDSVTVDGIMSKLGTGYTFEAGENLKGTMKIKVRDLKPHEAIDISFKVRFNNDAAGTNYVNRAAATSANVPGTTMECKSVAFQNAGTNSAIHQAYFVGFPNRTWVPVGSGAGSTEATKYLTVNEVGRPIFNSLTRQQFSKVIASIGGLDGARDKEQYILAPGHAENLNISDAKPTALIWKLGGADTKEIDEWRQSNLPGMCADSGRVKAAARSAGLNIDGMQQAQKVHRVEFAKHLALAQGRDLAPDTNGLPVRTFIDVPAGSPYYNIVTEASNTHLYVLDNAGHEKWIHLLLNYMTNM